MADTKITALTALTAADPASDVLPIVDISDTTMAASGTTKKISINNILGASGTATLASATITGDLTVDTNVLKVNTTTNRVGINTTTPSQNLEITGSGNPLSVDGCSAVRLNNTVSGRPAVVGVDDSQNFVIWNVGTEVSETIKFLTGGGNGKEQYRITHGGVFNWYDGAGGTRMTLNSTGLGVGVSPSYKLDVQGTGIRLNSGSATGFTILRLGGTASDSFFGFAGNANDIVTGSSAGDTVIGSNKAGANLRFISGNGSLNATLDASGNLLIGKTSSANNAAGVNIYKDATDGGRVYLTRQSGSASQTNVAFFESGGSAVGSISTTNTATSYNISSDYRLKQEVQPLVGGLARISALKPSIYKWKIDGSSSEGFLAHELAEAVPLAVTGEKDAVNEDGSIKPQAVDLSKVVPVLVAAIQELAAEVNALKNA